MARVKTDAMRREENRRRTILMIYLGRFSDLNGARGLAVKISKDTGKHENTARNRIKRPWEITIEELRMMKPTKEQALAMIFGT